MSADATSRADRAAQDRQLVPDDVIPRGDLPPLAYRPLPDPPTFRHLIGPGIILAGLSLGSGEFILWPYITFKSQFIFFWACIVGVTTQYFINMEVTRWTLATGETAVTGFARLSRHWAWIFLLANLIPHMIPAWGTGAAQLFSWLFWPPELTVNATGEPLMVSPGAGYIAPLAIVGMVMCGILLTAGPVVYKTIELTQMILVALVLTLVMVIAVLIVRPDAIVTQLQSTLTLGAPQFVPLGPDFPGIDATFLLGALAFAGCGGTLNLGQSNYVKDKGMGMGRHIGRITSPITGQEEAVSEIGYHFHHSPENMARWHRWWRLASREHFFSFYLTCVFCLVVLTLISYSLFYTPDGALREDVAKFGRDLKFIFGQSQLLGAEAGSGASTMFLVMGITILFTTELAVLDVVSRIATDIVKVNWLRTNSWWSESRLYYAFLWSEIAVGALILIVSRESVAEDTLKNFKIVASINGGIMCIYSVTLLWLNCRYLPKPLRMSKPRIAAMIWSVAFFGFFAAWAVKNLLTGA